MLPTIIYLLELLHRAIRRGSRHLFVLADVFRDAMAHWRATKRKYPFAE